MRIVGHRSERQITPTASPELLLEGARFNDEIHKLPGGNVTRIPKGVYRFKTHEEANRQQEQCIVELIVQLARERIS